MMKLQVNLKVVSECQKESISVAFATFDFVANDTDSVSCVKERIAVTEYITFPTKELLLDGVALEDESRISDHAIANGTSLDFVVKASETILVQQLSEFLKSRDLSCEELALLYCYTNSAPVSKALKLVGHEDSFLDFVKKQKRFILENGKVSLVREDTALKPFSVADEIIDILKASPLCGMHCTALSSKFEQKFNVSFTSIAGMRLTEYLAQNTDLFVQNGRGLISLRNRRQMDVSMPPGLGEPPVVVEIAVQDAAMPSDATEAAVKAKMKAAAESADQNQRYLDLHDNIYTEALSSKMSQALDDLVAAITKSTFLSIHHVVKGGSIGKGTALVGTADAEVVLVVNGLPPTGQSKWTQGLLKAVAGVLQMSEEVEAEDVRIAQDCLHLRTKDLAKVVLRISPVYDSSAQVLSCLSESCPGGRRYYATSLAEERTRFIAEQPESVKITIRLLKWWRAQQRWSSMESQPSDEVLELLAVHSALQTKPADQRVAVANVMSLLARFGELRIVWPAYHYTKEQIWAPLRIQRPLLMDPTNPFVNVAESEDFDARELMSVASSTCFFW